MELAFATLVGFHAKTNRVKTVSLKIASRKIRSSKVVAGELGASKDDDASAEGATAPETLRQPDRYYPHFPKSG
jgi:hypothetical protein